MKPLNDRFFSRGAGAAAYYWLALYENRLHITSFCSALLHLVAERITSQMKLVLVVDACYLFEGVWL